MTEQTVQNGKYVTLSYTILDEDGNVVEQHDVPIGYVHGSDTQLIGGMDRAVLGKRPGDEVEVILTPEQSGFGEHDPNLTFTDDLSNVPPEFHRIGAEVAMQNEAGDTRTFHVSRIEDGKLTVDGNHPLAGKTLKVIVKIHDVRDAAPGEEQVSGINAVQMQGPGSIN